MLPEINNMPEWAEAIGAFIRWLINECNTKIRDETGGNFLGTWGPSYNTENMIIGYIITIFILGLLIWIVVK
ncbi:MAG: hypothetical protein ACOXZV_14200 [Bacteroidales bacterium]|jgi:hypothetical protein